MLTLYTAINTEKYNEKPSGKEFAIKAMNTNVNKHLKAEEVAIYLANGATICCGAFTGGLKKENWISSDLICLDIDNEHNGEVIEPQLVLNDVLHIMREEDMEANFAYNTFSNGKNINGKIISKFRVVYVFNRTISKQEDMEFLCLFIKRITKRLKQIDSSVIRPTAQIYGGKELIYKNFGSTIDVDELIKREVELREMEKLEKEQNIKERDYVYSKSGNIDDFNSWLEPQILPEVINRTNLDSYEDYIKIGMALKSNGYDQKTWDRWCEGHPKFNQKENDYKWETFNNDIDFGYIINFAKSQFDYDGWRNEKFKEWVEEFNNSLPFEEEEEQEVSINVEEKEEQKVDNKDDKQVDKQYFGNELLNSDSLFDFDSDIIKKMLKDIDCKSRYYQPEAWLLNIICYFGNQFGQVYKTPGGVYTNLMTCVVADSSEGKTQTLNYFTKLRAVKTIDNSRDEEIEDFPEEVRKFNCFNSFMGDEFRSYQGELKSLFLNGGTGVHIIDEMGHEFNKLKKSANSHEQNITKMLTDIFTRSGSSYNEGVTLKSRKPFFIEKPNISIMGTTTLNQLEGAFNEDDIMNGALNRWLFIFGRKNAIKSTKKRLNLESTISEDVLSWLFNYKMWRFKHYEAFETTYEKEKIVVPHLKDQITIEEPQDVAEMFEDYFDWCYKNLDEKRKVFRSKSPELTRKVASVIAITRNFKKPKITKEDAQWAIRFVDLCYRLTEEKAFGIFEVDINEKKFQKRKDSAFNIIKKHGMNGISRSKWANSFKYGDCNFKNSIINTLEDEGRIIVEKNIDKKGKTKTLYFPNE